MAEQKLIRRECDFCGTVQEFKEKAKEFSAAEMRAAESWITLVELFFPLGDMYVVQKHACKPSCAKNIIELGMLALPPEIKQQVELESQRLAMQAAAQADSPQVGKA
ncbi:MAG TPA: hypothetical protein VHW72_18385 [Candidatus Angelobacter sp.]|jgi:hypothetical protein|nr:hypothetical protein [Candidatus Angelobacter sp.]